MKLIEFLILLTIISCASKVRRISSIELPQTYSILQKSDYVYHYNKLGDDFLRSNKSKRINLSRRQKKFLEGIINKVKRSNEVIIDLNEEIEIIVLKSDQPYHFSLPDGRIIFSNEFLKSYIKNEDLLVAVIVLEMVRVANSFYKKNLIVPIGHVSYDDLIQYFKISLKDRDELNKWSFYSIRRSGYDPLGLLRLIQLKNKNFLDFISSQETSDFLSREETLLKSFLIRNKLLRTNNYTTRNSTQDFYRFLREIERA